MTKPAREPMKVVPRDIVEVMRVDLTGRADAMLMPRYGISYNTWRKVQAGDAIRRSVAERLEQRLRGGSADGMQRNAHR